MDEKKYLKAKEKIKEFKKLYLLGVIGGIIAIILGFIYPWLALAIGCSVVYIIAASSLVIGIGIFFLICGLWVKRKARDSEIELEIFHRQQQGKAQ